MLIVMIREANSWRLPIPTGLGLVGLALHPLVAMS